MGEAPVQKFFKRFIWNSEPEKRASGETVNLENPNVPLNGFTIAEIMGGGRPSTAGVIVTPENSLQISAVWRCVSILAGIISSLPCQVFAETDTGRELAKKHPTYKLFKRRPSPLYTKSVYFERAIYHLLMRGNHYAEIIENRDGSINRFDLLNPMQIMDIKLSGGKLWYFIRDRKDPVPAERMIHVPNLGEDPVAGKSVITYAREDLGLEMARRNWGGKFWFDGGMSSGLLTTAQPLNDAQRGQAKDAYRNAKREGGDVLLPFGFDYKKMSIDPADAEFIMSGNYSIATICRWFGVPLDKLSELSRATHSNIEHQAIAFLQDTIAPIINKIEEEYTTKCYTLSGDYDIGGEDDVYMSFDMEAYIRADSTARAEMYRTGIQNGYIMPNEVREDIHKNKVEGADRLFIQQNMMPLDKVDQVLLKQTKPPINTKTNLRQAIRELAELAELEQNGNGNGQH